MSVSQYRAPWGVCSSKMAAGRGEAAVRKNKLWKAVEEAVTA